MVGLLATARLARAQFLVRAPQFGLRRVPECGYRLHGA